MVCCASAFCAAACSSSCRCLLTLSAVLLRITCKIGITMHLHLALPFCPSCICWLRTGAQTVLFSTFSGHLSAQHQHQQRRLCKVKSLGSPGHRVCSQSNNGSNISGRTQPAVESSAGKTWQGQGIFSRLRNSFGSGCWIQSGLEAGAITLFGTGFPRADEGEERT
jgi:hypothetical protein